MSDSAVQSVAQCTGIYDKDIEIPSVFNAVIIGKTENIVMFLKTFRLPLPLFY